MTQLLKTKNQMILKNFNKYLSKKTNYENIKSNNFSNNFICKASFKIYLQKSVNSKNQKLINETNRKALSANLNTDFFFNSTFDKGRLKSLILWFLKNYGQKKTIDLLEELKVLGYGYATKAGISLGIEDLKVPPQKISLLVQAEKQIQIGQNLYKRGEISGVERLQRLIDTWHQTSESLKQEVIRHFEATDLLNPVYMMAFSGARGNISQVRQLVGMRGLMSDPQGQIIDFPIRSNFREGLTLTEYIISTYGARKGIVDTALRTANAGYLTRRLVDVAQHVIVAKLDCGTTRGILVFDMKEGFKTIYSFQNRLIGRVLAKEIISENKTIAFKNQEISSHLAEAIAKVTKKAYIRSPLTCKAKKLVCQLCYGWSLANNKLVSIGEAVGIIAAQSIGEPGTQLTMRTFHTGGVFSGGMSEQVIAQHEGYVEYTSSIPGLCVRTPQGDLAFLTKAEGTLIYHKLKNFDSTPFKTTCEDNLSKTKRKLSDNVSIEQENIYTQSQTFKIPPYSLLFMRHNQKVKRKQIIAQLSAFSSRNVQKGDAEQTLYSELEGQVYLSDVNLLEKFSEYDDFSIQILGKGYAWILSGKIYQMPFDTKMFAQPTDFVNKNTLLNQIQWVCPNQCLLSNNVSYVPKRTNNLLNFSNNSLSTIPNPSHKILKLKPIETINFARTQINSSSYFATQKSLLNTNNIQERNTYGISLKNNFLTVLNYTNKKIWKNKVIYNNKLNNKIQRFFNITTYDPAYPKKLKSLKNKNLSKLPKFTKISSIRLVQQQFQYSKNFKNTNNFFMYHLKNLEKEKKNKTNQLLQKKSSTFGFSTLNESSKYIMKTLATGVNKINTQPKNRILNKNFRPIKSQFKENNFRSANKYYETEYLKNYPFQKYTRKYLLKLFNKKYISFTKKRIINKGLLDKQKQINHKSKHLVIVKKTFSLNKWTILHLIRNYVAKQTIQNQLIYNKNFLTKNLVKTESTIQNTQNSRNKLDLNNSFFLLSTFSKNKVKRQENASSLLDIKKQHNNLNTFFSNMQKTRKVLNLNTALSKKQGNISTNTIISSNIILKKSVLLMNLTTINYKKTGYSFSSQLKQNEYQFFTIFGIKNKTQKTKIALKSDQKVFQSSYLSPFHEDYVRKIQSISTKFFQPLLSKKSNFIETTNHLMKTVPSATHGNFNNINLVYSKKQLNDSYQNIELHKNTYNWKPYPIFVLKWNPSFYTFKNSGIFYFNSPFTLNPLLNNRKKLVNCSINSTNSGSGKQQKMTNLKVFSCDQFNSKSSTKDFFVHRLSELSNYSFNMNPLSFIHRTLVLKTKENKMNKINLFSLLSIQTNSQKTETNKKFYYFIDSILSEFSFGEGRKNLQYRSEVSTHKKQFDKVIINKSLKLNILSSKTIFNTYKQLENKFLNNSKTIYLLLNRVSKQKENNEVLFKTNFILEKRNIKNKNLSFYSYCSFSFKIEDSSKSTKILKITTSKKRSSFSHFTKNQKYVIKQNQQEEKNIAFLKKQKGQKKFNLLDQKDKTLSYASQYSLSSKKKFSVNLGEIYWIPQENYEIFKKSESSYLFHSPVNNILEKRELLVPNIRTNLFLENSNKFYNKTSYRLSQTEQQVFKTINQKNDDFLPALLTQDKLHKKHSLIFVGKEKNSFSLTVLNRQGNRKQTIPSIKGLVKIKKQNLKVRTLNNFNTKQTLNSSLCLSHIKLKFLKFIYKKYILVMSLKNLTKFPQKSFNYFFENKEKLKNILTKEIKGEFKNKTMFLNQLIFINKINKILNSNSMNSELKVQNRIFLNNFNDLESNNVKNQFINKEVNLSHFKNLVSLNLQTNRSDSVQKINISLQQGWVVIIHKEKNLLKTSYHNSIYDLGNKIFENIMFDTHRVSIKNILITSIKQSYKENNNKKNDFLLKQTKKQSSSFNVTKWIHSSFEDPFLRIKYNFINKNDKKKVRILKSELKKLNSETYQVISKPQNRIVFFIRPIQYFLLPHIQKYKKEIYKLHKKIEEPSFSLLLMEQYSSSFLNKQKKDLKLLSHNSNILLNLSTKSKFPILYKKSYFDNSLQKTYKSNTQSFVSYRPFPLIQFKLMYKIPQDSVFKIPQFNFNMFLNISLQACQFYQSKSYQLFLRSILTKSNFFLMKTENRNNQSQLKSKNSILSLYYLNFFSFSPCFDYSLNSKMSTFANQRIGVVSGIAENGTNNIFASYSKLSDKQSLKNNFYSRSKVKIQKNKIKTKPLNIVQKNEILGWTGFYSPFEGEILFDQLHQVFTKQNLLNLTKSDLKKEKYFNILSTSFISRFNKIKKQVTDANIKLLKTSSLDFSKKSNLLVNELGKISSTNQQHSNFSHHSHLLLTKADLFTLNFPSESKLNDWESSITNLTNDTTIKKQFNLKKKVKNNLLLITLINYYKNFLNIENQILIELKNSNEKMISQMPFDRNTIQYKNEKYQIKKLRVGSVNLYPKLRLESFLLQHDPISTRSVTKKSGQIIHIGSSKLTLRNAQPIAISNRGMLYYQNGDFITKNSPVVTLPFQTLKTGDIVQGIPKVEQILEARTTRGGRLFLQSLPVLLQCLFERYTQIYPSDIAARKSILKIQQLIVDAIQRVYRSQGVSIADKHVEIIVRQMTMKVQIIHPGYTGFFPGEFINLETIEFINESLLTKVKYAPIVLGISKAALEVDSFLSAASFQYTTKVLTKAALFRKRDFLKGLKENLLVGNLLPAGTGYFVYLQDQKTKRETLPF